MSHEKRELRSRSHTYENKRSGAGAMFMKRRAPEPEFVVSEFLPHYNEIDFCGPRLIFVDEFGPSRFLSCAGL